MLPVDVLRLEFCRRKGRNQRYSVRSFARDLRISPGALSQILAGKRPLTHKKAKQIAELMPLSPQERTFFLQNGKQNGSGSSEHGSAKLEISEDAYHLVSEWYHFAILSLSKTEQFRNDTRWIAKRLGITPIEAEAAIARLLRLELLRETPDGLAETGRQIADIEATSGASMRYHQRRLEHALDNLEQADEASCVILSTSIAIDAAKLDHARRLIEDFRNEVIAKLEADATNEVYDFNIQLVPVSRPADLPVN